MNKLLIWGTGKLAHVFIQNGFHGEIIGFIETYKIKETFMGKPVFSYKEFPAEYDYVIVANSYSSEIYNLCVEKKIDISKFIFLYGVKDRIGCKNLLIVKKVLSERNYTNYCIEFGFEKEAFIKADASLYQKLNKRKNFDIKEKYMWPVIKDKYGMAGTINNYFLQDLWAAKLIIRSGIKKHFDIGSRLDGFIAHLLAADIDVTMIDIRNFPGEIEHLHTIVDDATDLCQIANNEIESMSALCSIEHFGLGRYGDKIDPEACFKCFDNIQKKLRKGGSLYISLPIGKERVEFNAHRVFYPRTIVECFYDLELKEFSCAAEGNIEYDVGLCKYDEDMHDGEYRYGLFHFIKKV